MPISVSLHETWPQIGHKYILDYFQRFVIEIELMNKANVMVNLIWQPDWATGYPDIWSNVILGVSKRMFLEESIIWMGRLSSLVCLGFIK